MKFVALDKVAKIDRTVASEKECETLPYVGLEHIEKDTGRFAAEFEGKPESLRATKFKFTSRHVLYGKLRPYLNKVALPAFDGVCTTEILPILPIEDKLDRTYLWAFLLTPGFIEWASSNVSGANLPRISPKLLAKYRIPLPPLPEQKHIAAILAKADRLRRLRRTARDLSATYLQSVFLEMFGDPVSNPMGWDNATLKSLCAEPFTNGVTLTQQSMGHGTKLVNVVHLYENHTIDTSKLDRARISEKQFKTHMLKKGDIVFVRSSVKREGAAMCAYFPGDEEPATFGCFNIRFRPKLRLVDPVFLSVFLRIPEGRRRLLNFCRTATITNINQNGLGAVQAPLPPLPLQQQFAHIVHQFERLRAQQREAERQAEHLFQTLLHRAFRGEL